jgi:ABC transporter substrate binding protein
MSKGSRINSTLAPERYSAIELLVRFYSTPKICPLHFAVEWAYANNTPIVQELQRQTRTIPIVFASIGDPVDTSVVGSLARPGGNATGFSNWEPAMGGKRLALLKEVAPGVNRVLVMVNSGSDSNQHELRAIETAASCVRIVCGGERRQ